MIYEDVKSVINGIFNFELNSSNPDLIDFNFNANTILYRSNFCRQLKMNTRYYELMKFSVTLLLIHCQNIISYYPNGGRHSSDKNDSHNITVKIHIDVNRNEQKVPLLERGKKISNYWYLDRKKTPSVI